MKQWKNTEHREFIIELVRLFEPHTYAEIGVKRGYVFNAVAPLVKRAIAVDIADMGRISDLPGVEKYQMKSSEFAYIWHDPIDLLFIDADHRDWAVLADIFRLAKFVRDETGLILLHDTFPVDPKLLADGYCSNAWKAARHIHLKRRHLFEIVTLPGPWAGLSIMRKAARHGWMEDNDTA
ncbi:class I SAM-dependent methyltransferase [Patescibacteria group bacterium]|uniref:Putative methyltransferase n=1 Tax=viral metagenome TaxID=1070528 RepID=A0A6M3KPY7_9ZZZZ|nr:class I SAM-dependent methyltransferase [Patescibacteria group bacterium]